MLLARYDVRKLCAVKIDKLGIHEKLPANVSSCLRPVTRRRCNDVENLWDIGPLSCGARRECRWPRLRVAWKR